MCNRGFIALVVRGNMLELGAIIIFYILYIDLMCYGVCYWERTEIWKYVFETD